VTWEGTHFLGKIRFFSAAVATLTLRVLNPYGNGRLVLLETHYTQDYHTNVIYGVAIVLGIYGVSCARAHSIIQNVNI
jgi:chloride channel 3/4/5